MWLSDNLREAKLKSETYPLIERKGAPAVSVEWQRTKTAAQQLIDKV
ncbi:MAG: hypothetical protein M3139_09545 [Bacteroidota bacterium]|nr:hypothetical protein [Bacteroidota bacterium]